jgi:hypothetical protein
MNLFVKMNASDRAVYEAFIATQMGLTLESVAIKSFGLPNPSEYV